VAKRLSRQPLGGWEIEFHDVKKSTNGGFSSSTTQTGEKQMLCRIISLTDNLSPWKLVLTITILSAASSCGTVPSSTPNVDIAEPHQTVVADVFTPTPQVLESTPAQTNGTATMELFSSDRLSLCFSYPQGYTQIPYNDTVEIIAPELPGSDLRGLFWLEISDSYNRSAEKIADQEMTYAEGVDVGRWIVTLDGEQAVVLDGMPGQDLQRRVYVVHQQTLYVLAFMPTRSENKAASDQMEALYAAVTNSWSWSPCS
jgi:hypothetical protein